MVRERKRVRERENTNETCQKPLIGLEFEENFVLYYSPFYSVCETEREGEREREKEIVRNKSLLATSVV